MQLGILLSLVVTMVFISAAQMIHLASVNDILRHKKQYVYEFLICCCLNLHII